MRLVEIFFLQLEVFIMAEKLTFAEKLSAAIKSYIRRL